MESSVLNLPDKLALTVPTPVTTWRRVFLTTTSKDTIVSAMKAFMAMAVESAQAHQAVTILTSVSPSMNAIHRVQRVSTHSALTFARRILTQPWYAKTMQIAIPWLCAYPMPT